MSASAARRSIRTELAGTADQTYAGRLSKMIIRKKYAGIVIAFAAVLGIVGFAASSRLSIGDVDPGAPELMTMFQGAMGRNLRRVRHRHHLHAGRRRRG